MAGNRLGDPKLRYYCCVCCGEVWELEESEEEPIDCKVGCRLSSEPFPECFIKEIGELEFRRKESRIFIPLSSEELIPPACPLDMFEADASEHKSRR